MRFETGRRPQNLKSVLKYIFEKFTFLWFVLHKFPFYQVTPCRWRQLVQTQRKQQTVLPYSGGIAKQGGNSHLRNNDLLENSHEDLIPIINSEVQLR